MCLEDHTQKALLSPVVVGTCVLIRSLLISARNRDMHVGEKLLYTEEH